MSDTQSIFDIQHQSLGQLLACSQTTRESAVPVLPLMLPLAAPFSVLACSVFFSPRCRRTGTLECQQEGDARNANAPAGTAQRLARQAAGFIPGWQGRCLEPSVQVPIDSSRFQTFKLSCKGLPEEFSFRVLWASQDDMLSDVSNLLSSSGLTPPVIAQSPEFLAQLWMSNSCYCWQVAESDQCPSSMRQLATFVARFHNIDYKVTAIKESERGLARPADLREGLGYLKHIFNIDTSLAARLASQIDAAEQDIFKYLRPRPLVLTHGDLHSANILVENNRLYFIDFETAGPRPRETDLAYLFYYAPVSYCRRDYVSKSLREAFAESYLHECDPKPISREEIEMLLFDIEVESLFQIALLIGRLREKHIDVHEEYAALFPIMHEILVEARQNDRIRAQVVNVGVLELARRELVCWDVGRMPTPIP